MTHEFIIEKMKEKGVVFTDGLKIEEIRKIEKLYAIKFPSELKKFYSIGLPISEDDSQNNKFPLWNDFSKKNIMRIKKWMTLPIQRILQGYKDDDGTILADLGVGKLFEEGKYDERFSKIEQKRNEYELKRFLSTLETVIPIYSHRYMILKYDDDNAVISAWGTDITAYGTTIKDYLINEFIDSTNLKDIYDRLCEDTKNGECQYRRTLGMWKRLIIR